MQHERRRGKAATAAAATTKEVELEKQRSSLKKV
jgi:hypothetical protein